MPKNTEVESKYTPEQLKAMDEIVIRNKEGIGWFFGKLMEFTGTIPKGSQLSAEDVARFVVSLAVEDVESPLAEELQTSGLNVIDFYHHMYNKTVDALQNIGKRPQE
jgi:hypothetical protein